MPAKSSRICFCQSRWVEVLRLKQAQKFAQVVVPAPLKEPLLYSIPQPLDKPNSARTRVLIRCKAHRNWRRYADYCGKSASTDKTHRRCSR